MLRPHAVGVQLDLTPQRDRTRDEIGHDPVGGSPAMGFWKFAEEDPGKPFVPGAMGLGVAASRTATQTVPLASAAA